LLVGGKERNHGKENTKDKTPALAVRQSTEVESDSSDSEFECLIERIRKQSVSQKLVFSTSKTVNQPSTIENRKPSWEGPRPSKGEEDKKPRSNSILPKETPSRITSVRSSGSESGSYTPLTQTKEKCNSCSVPGCFLQDLSNPSSQFVKYFKKNKEDLTQKLYRLYNNTIFEQKLPEKMEIIWNKKMRKTAGYCITGQTKSPEAQRYARIELSEKVCDSADRLRDTLIHEICHA
ncbi:ACRC protein, partial [Crypturellus undulatus]|nr:ACRC protein [Crypturellus undulatus]